MVAVGEMRRDFQPACPAHAHPFQSVAEAGDERAPIDPDLGNQTFAVVLEPRDARPPQRPEGFVTDRRCVEPDAWARAYFACDSGLGTS